jgi:hypothetical protein
MRAGIARAARQNFFRVLTEHRRGAINLSRRRGELREDAALGQPLPGRMAKLEQQFVRDELRIVEEVAEANTGIAGTPAARCASSASARSCLAK